MTSYTIRRGIDKPIEFRGLKGQYIIYAAGMVIGDILLFAILYICRVDSWICVTLSFGLGGGGISMLYKRSSKYGAYGWAKRRAARYVPSAIRCKSRSIFTDLNSNSCNNK